MKTTSTTLEPPRDEPLMRRLLCHRCDYDLRGLPNEGRCPECGESIETSMQAYIGAAEGEHVRWLRDVRNGATLFCILLFVPTLVSGDSVNAKDASPIAKMFGNWRFTTVWPYLIEGVIFGLVPVLAWLAARRVAAPLPAGRSGHYSANVARIGATISMVLYASFYLIPVARIWFPMLRFKPNLGVGNCILFVAPIAGSLLLFLHVASLARRTAAWISWQAIALACVAAIALVITLRFFPLPPVYPTGEGLMWSAGLGPAMSATDIQAQAQIVFDRGINFHDLRSIMVWVEMAWPVLALLFFLQLAVLMQTRLWQRDRLV